MKWILILLITAFCSAQVTLTDEESKKIAINVQNLQFEVDSLKNIVFAQSDLIFNYREIVRTDSALTAQLEEKIEILEGDTELLEKKVVKFCRLFLAQEKKRKKIKDYNRADVRLLYTLSISCSLNEVEKLIVKNGWTLEVGHQFEKEIGYT